MSVSHPYIYTTNKTKYFKVIILGDSNVGKTSLINRYVKNAFSPIYKSKDGADFCSKRIYMTNGLITLKIWNIACQDQFHALDRFYCRADACVLVYDVTNEASFRNLNAWRLEVLTRADLRDPAKFPFLVMGNKVDLGGRQISTEEVRNWCEKNQISYFETSAKDDVNVKAAFQFLAEKVGEDSGIVNLVEVNQEEIPCHRCTRRC